MQHEAESPRGRIALIEGVLRGDLAVTPALTSHLENCLECRACERVCPAGVQYGALLAGSRDTWTLRAPLASRWVRWGLRSLTQRTPRRRLANLARWYQRLGLQRAARMSGILRLLGVEVADALLAAPLSPLPSWQSYYPPQASSRGDVALFLGCVNEAVDAATLQDAIAVLTCLGYGVHVPLQQSCCGALHAHLGDDPTARALINHNALVFSNVSVQAILTVASGCGAHLYEQGKTFAAPIQDICAFLAAQSWPDGVVPAPWSGGTILVHDPCTLTNVQRTPQAVYTLLQRIPGMTVYPLPGNAQCCGAAGSYMLTHVELAAQLRAPKLAAVIERAPAYVVSSNIGCALHLSAGLRAQHSSVTVCHPVSLLARQLR